MFYCNTCAEKEEWPTSMCRSVGKCEICGNNALCNDVPSSRLQKKLTTTRISTFVKLGKLADEMDAAFIHPKYLNVIMLSQDDFDIVANELNEASRHIYYVQSKNLLAKYFEIISRNYTFLLCLGMETSKEWSEIPLD